MHNFRQLELCHVGSVQLSRHSPSPPEVTQSPSPRQRSAYGTPYDPQHILNSALVLHGWYRFFPGLLRSSIKFLFVPFGVKQAAEIDFRICPADTKRKISLRSINENLIMFGVGVEVEKDFCLLTASFFGLIYSTWRDGAQGPLTAAVKTETRPRPGLRLSETPTGPSTTTNCGKTTYKKPIKEVLQKFNQRNSRRSGDLSGTER